MAFVRRKTVKGKKYYQWVRNYREDGLHKQEVLAHLGRHRSPEAAIAHHKERIAFYEGIWEYERTWEEVTAVEGRVSSQRREAMRMKAKLLEKGRYAPDEVPFGYAGKMHQHIHEIPLDEGEIPDEDTTKDALRELRAYAKWYRGHDYEVWWRAGDEEQWYEPWIPYHEHLEADEIPLWEEELQMDIELAEEILAYHRVAVKAFLGEYAKMQRHRAKLDKLLAVYEKYGGEPK